MNNVVLFLRVQNVLIFKFTAVPQGRVYVDVSFFQLLVYYWWLQQSFSLGIIKYLRCESEMIGRKHGQLWQTSVLKSSAYDFQIKPHVNGAICSLTIWIGIHLHFRKGSWGHVIFDWHLLNKTLPSIKEVIRCLFIKLFLKKQFWNLLWLCISMSLGNINHK